MSSAPSIEDIYPLSPMQQGMLFHLLDEPGAGLNVIQLSCALRGRLDVDAFRRALGRVIERHAVLRTSFLWEEVDQPLQVVDREVPVPLAVEDWSGLGAEERRQRLEEYLAGDLARGFDLTQAPLMRVLLAREGTDVHRLVWSIQLILFDGWSLPAVIGEVLFHYEAFRAGEEPRLPVPRRYRDYIAWLLQRDAGEGERFWRRELAGFTAPTPLPGDLGPGRRPAMAQRRVFLPEPDTAAVQALARRERLTANTVIQAAWALLLARAGGLDDVVFGATVSGRPHDLPGVEGMIGLFINTLPVRVRLEPGRGLVEWLRGFQERQAEARQHEHVPLVDVQGWSEVPRGLPLFESIVVFENYPVAEAVAGGRGTLELDEIRVLDANSYPLTLEIQPGARLSLRLTYDGSRFALRTIEELLSRLGDLLRQLAAGGARLSDVLLSAAERQQLVAEWNDTAVPRPPGLSLHGLFLARAAAAPDAVALTFEGTGLSYGELRRRAGLLAGRLRSMGCGPEARAAVALDRSPELVIALLGVLASGAAYVPLDPEQPADRLSRMLEDARPVALLTRADLQPRLPGTTVPTLLLAGGEERGEAESLPPAIDGRQLAYVIFTSGSTGRPKASMLHHRGIVNRLLWMAETYALSPADVVLQKTPIGFDVSVWELFAPLATGGRLVLARPDGHRDPAYLAGLVAREGVTVLHFVASMLRSYLDAPELPACPSPRLLVASGEAMTADLVARYGGRFPAAALENLYGPTEASVEVSAWSCAGQTDGPVPIGRPVANVRLHLIGRHGEPAAAGAPGELWIAGVAVGRGYLGRPDLTAERFVPDPFPALPGDRAYRTGDLARRRPDGAIEFLGRIDQQVKIRGFRIEPEEIAAVLASHPAVRQAVVAAVDGDGGVPRLVAWVVASEADGAGGAGMVELRQHLRDRLPEPMVPGLIVPLPALPLTASGKVDRRALPLPEAWDEAAAAGEHVAPRNGFEEILADIWAAVLGRERVGAQDDFFALGGHSLLGVQVISRVRSAFGVELPVRALFNARTVAGLAAVVEEATRGGAAPLPPLVSEPWEPRDEGGLPLSFAQQRLWFLHQLDPESTAYNMPVAVRLAGELDRPALERALREVARRHEALRTTFRQVDGRAVQVIAPQPELALPLVDLSGLGAVREAEALRLATVESRRPFDLERGPLFRPVLLRVAAGDHIVSATMHHIVSDERSLEVFVREVTALYAAFGAGLPSPLPELPVQYGDYAVWQRRWLAGAAMDAELAFWRRELQGLPPVLELPADRPRPEVRSARGGSLDRNLGPAPATRLRDLARELGATPFMVALAAYQAFLGRFAGVDDLAVGVPVAGRTLQEVEDLIGFFVNTLVIRADLSGDPSFLDIVLRARERSLAAQAHQAVPFDKLVEELHPERSLDHSPLVQVTLTHQAPTPGLPALLGVTGGEAVPAIRGVRLERETAQFDLSLFVHEVGGDLLLGWGYSADLFDAVSAGRLADRFQGLLLGALASPSARLSALPLLAPAERHQLLVEWNDTASAYPAGEGLASLFARQVRRDPDAPAVRYGEEELTYGELESQANRLANHLRALGIGRGTPVGIAVERSVRAVVAMLAVIKAGGAYVPLDPSEPAERLAFVLEDSGTPVILARDDFPLWLPGLWVVSLDAEAAMIAAQPETPPETEGEADGSDLAYIIYTSGSTGRPKGVAVPQGAVARLVLETDYVRLGPGRRVGQAATTTFDAATFEIWGPLLTGALVVGLPREVTLAPGALAAALRELAIDTLFLTTALFNRIAREDRDAFAPLQDFFVGGEAADPARMADMLRSPAAPARFSNIYGPTESTTFALRHHLEEVPAGAASIPIGRPIANTRAYVLDALGLPAVPAVMGAMGELLLGGDGLAWGYHRRPDLTAERFVPDPFAASPGGRLYRTGDLVRRRPDGAVEYLARVDHQVKLRGFRIEPGEIETVLAGHSGVRAAVVVMAEVEPGDRRLAAYFVPDPAAPPEPADLRRALEERLPDYMVPAAFVALERLPLTPGGKIDRRALPAVDWSGGGAAARYTAPRTAVEEVLAGIWEQVLKRERVGVDDDFFELGGHSLLATQVISRVRAAFNVDVPLRVLFEEPSVASLAAAVEELLRGGEAGGAPPLEPLPRPAQGPAFPLSFSQERLWFLHRLEPESAAYNMPIAVRLEGDLDRSALESALREIARRHESLRTTFREVDGEPAQVIAATTDLTLPLVDLAALGERAGEVAMGLAAADAGRPFDLARGPLFRPLLLRAAAADHVLVATMHHIVSDGWSLDVFVREVRALYGAFGAGLPSPLPELPIQYADYAVWQRRWLSGEVLEREMAFWRRELAGLPPVLELPADRPRPPLQSFRGASLPRQIAGRPSALVRVLARSYEATPFMVLLAAFEALLGRLTGAEDFAVGVPVSGRIRQEIEGLIGFFVNSLVVRADLAGDPPFIRLLGRARERVLATQSHQVVPFEKLVEVLQPERDLSSSPLFQVMLSHNVALPGEAAPVVAGPMVRPVAVERGASQFDLSLSFAEAEDRFLAGWEYASDLFDEVTVSRFADCFEVFVAAAVESPDRRLSDLPLLTPAERRQVLEEWNGTSGAPAPSTLVERWLERVRLTPEALAVAAGDVGEQRVTFAELARWAGRIARQLLELGTGTEDVVAVCLERSPASIAAMLGVFQAGGAYLPLDPAYPQSRIAYLLADSGARVLITRRGLLDALPAGLPPLLLVDGPEDGPGDDPGPDGPWPEVSPSQLAYVIYTSGSTGQPKGVGVEHGAAAVHFPGMAREYELGPGDRALWFTSPGFDASLDQVLPTLLSGAAVVPRGEELWSPADLLAVCGQLGLTVIDLAPAYWQQWVREQAPATPATGAEALRLVLVAGEAMPADELRRWWRTPMAAAGLINGYGPTEAVVTATMFRVERGWEPRPGAAAVPLGRPLAHRAAYVLDRHGHPAPVGVAGELCLGGLLARGYLGRPALTAERFVPDPWGRLPGGRLYRTGDLVRWNRDGLLDFLGRVDRQVKVRGVRIEPGEVEAALAAHPAVLQAVVDVHGDGVGGRRLVAWVVTAGGDLPADLLDGIRERLPESMVPSLIVPLEALPVTASGKVDRRALPAPDRALLRTAGGADPRTPVEETLAAVWREVLGLERVSVDDGFFDLGGHSLLATRVVSRVRNAFGVELPLRRIFEAPTIARLAAVIEKQMEAAPVAGGQIAAVSGTEGVPLSFAQQRLWFLHLLDPSSPAYNMPQALRWEGELDHGALAAALSEVVRRHEALRTCFRESGGDVVQQVLPAAPFHLPVVDLGGLGHRAEREASRLAGEDATRPFDLRVGPLLRVLLLRLSAAAHLVTTTMHHIVSDGASMDLFAHEVTLLYGACRAGLPSPLPELPMQYRDFALWQRRRLSGEALAAELEFWRRELRDLPVRLELPADRPRPPVQSFRGRSWTGSFGEPLIRALRGLARSEGATLFMVLLAAFQALLGRLAGTDDLAVGVPVSGRTRRELEDLIGFFVDSLVLRADLAGEAGFRALVGRTRERVLDAQAHQDLPFERLVEDLRPERNLSHSPLFQVMFSFDSAPREAVPGSLARLLTPERQAALFDLRVTVQELSRELLVGWEYSLDLFDRPTVLRFAGHFGNLLAGAVAAPDAPLSSLPLLSPTERAQLATEWNDTAAARPAGLTLQGLFAAGAARTPDAVAVTCEGASLSYGELSRRAGRLAARLRALGCGPEVLAAVALDRSPELVIALLGVLGAGAAWVPLDPDQPRERLAGMLEDARPAVLLTRGALLPRLPTVGSPVVLLDEPSGEEAGLAIHPLDGSELAYVIFTSGSTGRPKASMLQHRGIVNRLLWMLETYSLAPGDAVLQKTPIGFDVSVWELFAPLACGARLVLARPDGHRDAPYLADLAIREGVTVLHFVPSTLRAYLDEPGLPACASVRLLVASGEALTADLVTGSAARFPAAAVENLYGPTETSVEVAFWSTGGAVDGTAVPIGRPLSNVVLHVADRHWELAPAGVPGELWIGGVAVGRGYLGRPGLTAERFVPDPWGTAGDGAGARAYRSGDLARHRPDGAIEFLGRLDQQVKIRGVRVEPGEVETALAAHPAVRGAAVAARRVAGGPQLVAYVVTAGGVEPAALREHLRSRLPEAMVPAHFVSLEALPLTASGKVDRRALPEPGALAPAGDAAPRTAVEELLAGLWTEVLGLDRAGIHDDFFELGGHSLLATRLVSRLRNVFGVQLPLRRLFETPTIAGLAGWIEGQMGAGGGLAPRFAPVPRRAGEPVPLSFAQRRLWFLTQLEPETTAYNMPLVLRLAGEFSPAFLAAALSEVMRRHEALRTLFQEAGEEPVQVVLPAEPFRLPLADLSSLPGAVGEREVRRLVDESVSRPFDLGRGPLLRGLLLRLGESDHVIALTLHHIAGDAWSLRLLVQEMTLLYQAAAAGLPSPLPELPIQYADYAVWQRRWLEGAVLAEQLAYWRNQLGGDPPPLELPMEQPRPEVQTFRGAAADLALDAGLTAALHGLARSAGATPFMVLLTGFVALLSRYSGQTDVVVGSPIAGRNRQEVEGLIGFFLNTLALRTDAAGDPSFLELVGRVRETTLGAYTHQDLPFEHLLEELKPERSLARTPLFQVMINWDNSGAAGPAVVPLPELSLEVLDAGEPVAKFDLEMYAREVAGRLELKMVYNRDLFGADQVRSLLGHLEELLAGGLARPERRLSELLLEGESGPSVAPSPARSLSIPERFAQVAAEHPGLPAVWTPEGSWSYAELRSRAAGVAQALLGLDGPAERIALLFTPGAPMVAAIFGTLAAGKAYVPLDPSYPRERLLAMLDDSGAAVLLAGGDVRQQARDLAGGLPVLDFDTLPAAPAGWEPPPVPPEAVAYLLYTSGSTGEPKGVVQSQGNVFHHVGTYAARLGIGPGDRLTLLPSYGFDAAVMDLFGGLLHGAEVCPWDVKTRGSEGLAAWMAERQITVYHSTPTFFRHFAGGLTGTEAFPSLRWVVLGGEGVRPGDLELFQRLHAPGCRLVNGLGPTESTLALQAFYEQSSRVSRPGLPVGRPVAGTEVVLWNGAGRQVAVWGVGEILIRSPYLAHGYWRRPELTAAAFTPDPEGGAGRVYRTGDLGRLLPDGALEFAGRRDFQVKVRGIRVEPAEVEAALARHPGVREAAVVAAADASGETRLAAYLAAREGEVLSAAGLRAFLVDRLPPALVPTVFVFLPALPWTPTGKLDRRALPAPPAARAEGEEGRVAPRDEVEKALAAVWSELLGLPEEGIGVHDSFFDLGGHSLLITRVLARIQAVFGVVPPLRDLFAEPTIAGTAAAIAREREQATPSTGMKLSSVPRRGRALRREDLDREP